MFKLCWDGLVVFLRFFWPPKPGDEKKDYGWRVKVALLGYGVLGVNGLTLLWLFGYLPMWIPAPAMSEVVDRQVSQVEVRYDERVAQVETSIQELRSELLEKTEDIGQQNARLAVQQDRMYLSGLRRDLRETQTKLCLAQDMGNDLAAAALLTDLQAFEAEFFQASGDRYVRERCAVLNIQ